MNEKVIRYSKDRDKNVAALGEELDWWYNANHLGDTQKDVEEEFWIPVGPKLYWDVQHNYKWYEEQLSSRYSTHRVREYGGDEPLYYYRQKARLCFKLEPIDS